MSTVVPDPSPCHLSHDQHSDFWPASPFPPHYSPFSPWQPNLKHKSDHTCHTLAKKHPFSQNKIQTPFAELGVPTWSRHCAPEALFLPVSPLLYLLAVWAPGVCRCSLCMAGSSPRTFMWFPQSHSSLSKFFLPSKAFPHRPIQNCTLPFVSFPCLLLPYSPPHPAIMLYHSTCLFPPELSLSLEWNLPKEGCGLSCNLLWVQLPDQFFTYERYSRNIYRINEWSHLNLLLWERTFWGWGSMLDMIKIPRE